jgi:NAD(P)H-flavin reductase
MVDLAFRNHVKVVDPMQPDLFRIRRVVKETSDSFTLELMPVEAYYVHSFEPGQFNMLYVFGVGEIPISISGDPAHPERLVHTVRAVGAVTNAMNMLEVGDVVGVRGPYGTPWPVKAAKGHDVVFVAGGIGLAPLRSALYQILARREDFGKIVLLYGTRSPEDILYRRDLEHLRSRFDLEVHVTVDYAGTRWQGNVGVVTKLIPKAPFDPTHALAMVCGPEVMMRFTAAELEKRGVSADKIYLSLERNMKCAIGFCGHCQFGSRFICKDGPVFPYDEIRLWLNRWEV